MLESSALRIPGHASLVTALLTAALTIQCGRPGQPELGVARVALTFPVGVTVDNINCQLLSSANAVVISRTFSVTDPNAAPTLDLPVPPGIGYRVTMSAVSSSTPVRTFFGMSPPFNVVSAETVQVSLVLTDVASSVPPSSVLINATIVPNDNPPVITSVIVAPTRTSTNGSIVLTATAFDPDPLDQISYLWTATGAVVASATSRTTTLSSSQPALEFAIVTLTVTDNHLPVPASTASTMLPFTILPSDPACPMEPGSSGPNCDACTLANCALGSSGTDGCCSLATAPDRSLCAAVVDCMTAHAATCSDLGDPTNCYCGTSGSACFTMAGAANGPCVAEVLAAAGTQVPGSVIVQFTSPASPLGRAVNLTTCRGGFCSAECATP
jgi:hypothetical protein